MAKNTNNTETIHCAIKSRQPFPNFQIVKLSSHPDISAMPFAKIAPMVVLGILVGNSLPLPLYVTTAALTVCIVAAIVWRRSDAAGIYVALSLFLFSMGLAHLNTTRDVMPKGPGLVMVMHISDTPTVSGRWVRATAMVDRFRYIDGGVPDKAVWEKSGEKVIVRFDTTFSVSAGDRIISTGRAGELGGKEYAGYVRLMRRRGYSATVWVGGGDEVVVLPGKARTPMYYASRMQAAAAERLSRLDADPTAMQVALAMSIGVRQDMEPSVRETYSLTGASHLLAVSGLHVGIVAMLVNLLLYFLPVFRRGHIIKNIVAIAVIWLYAMLAGLSPSVLRAAMMFTGVQLALVSSRERNGTNILLATATVMLLINPNYLYDVSFQLSFMAVLGIFLLYKPLYSRVKTRFRAANALWSVVIIGVAATLATMPLVSYYFERIPVIGILMNPLVVVTANVTVLMSMLWIIFPLGFLNGVFSSVIGFSAGLQNSIVEFCASKVWASAEVQLSGWQVVFVYLTALTIWYLVGRQIRSNDNKKLLQ